MDYQDIYLIINFETDDLADQMVREEDEIYPPVSEEEYIDNLLKEEELTLSALGGSFATMHNVDKKLYIKFDENNRIYTPSLLEYLELPLYVEFATTFNIPTKVKVVDVSSQVGGYIDTNYGIKFKIRIVDGEASEIRKSRNSERYTKKNSRQQADIYIRRKFGYSLNDEEYDTSINLFIDMMDSFFDEALTQRFHHDNQGNNSLNIFYTKDKSFHFGVYKNEYFAIIEINDCFFIYQKVNEVVNIIADVNHIENAYLEIDKYKKGKLHV